MLRFFVCSAALLLSASLTLAADAMSSVSAATVSASGASSAVPAFARTQLETVSRAERWKAMDVSYYNANTRRPALYYDSAQEKLANEKKETAARAAIKKSPVLAAPYNGVTMLYEWAQFPAQVLATPALVVAKPFWKTYPDQP